MSREAVGPPRLHARSFSFAPPVLRAPQLGSFAGGRALRRAIARAWVSLGSASDSAGHTLWLAARRGLQSPGAASDLQRC